MGTYFFPLRRTNAIPGKRWTWKSGSYSTMVAISETRAKRPPMTGFEVIDALRMEGMALAINQQAKCNRSMIYDENLIRYLR